jgi:hypothetical protein
MNCVSDSGEDLEIDCTQTDLTITITSQSDPTCNEAGTISVEASGGEGPYQFSLNGNGATSNNTFTELNAGDYNISVEDANGCTAQISTSLTGDVAIELSASVEGCGNGDGRIVISATGGNGDFLYQLNGGDFLEDNLFESLDAGIYDVTVRDGNGCTATKSNLKIGVSLDQDIMPIINNNCATNGCHLNNQSPILNSKSSVIAAAERIKSRTSAGTMPPSGPLPDEDIQAIVNWVDCGSNDN